MSKPRTLIFGPVAKIPLTKGMYATVDSADLPLLKQFSWFAHSRRGLIYPATNVASGTRRQRTVSMYNLLLPATSPEQRVDHVNRDTLDNRRANLRLVSCSENSINQKIRKDNSSGFKGVIRTRGKFRATISAFGKRHHIGYFDTAQAAAKAYDNKAMELFGSVAFLNFQKT